MCELQHTANGGGGCLHGGVLFPAVGGGLSVVGVLLFEHRCRLLEAGAVIPIREGQRQRLLHIEVVAPRACG